MVRERRATTATPDAGSGGNETGLGDRRSRTTCRRRSEGILLGGCLTLVETTLGTPWELDTHGAIVVLEDCAMKPYQVDRALMHLKQAGKFRAVAGILSVTFRNAMARIESM